MKTTKQIKWIFWILFLLSFGFAVSISKQHDLQQQNTLSEKCDQLVIERNRVRYFRNIADAINSGLNNMMETGKRYTERQLNGYIERNCITPISWKNPSFQSFNNLNGFLELTEDLIQSYQQ